ncbi:MAG TPA: polysaccharide biosynthesis C-terminal domain-containing protein [Kofleriaceae bacterium]|nr:polysaccharide biosynthesis C-terminal domain-containing protein [Kofleriaceae bacterium]
MDKRLRRDVIWNLAPVVLLGAVGLGMNILIAAWWHAAALGIFNLVSIAYFVLAVVGAWGIQYSVLRAVAEKPDDSAHKAAVVVGALVPNVVLAALATAIFFASRNLVARLHGSDEVAEGMLYATPGLFCFAVNKVLFGIVNGQRRMRAFAIYTSLRYVLIAVGIVAAHVMRIDAAHLPVIWTFTEGTLLLVLIGETIATVTLARAAGWQRWAREHVAYGARGVTATLAYEIQTKLDVWMVGAAGFPKAAVGIYSLAAALNEGATQLAVVVMNNINPVMAQSLATGRRDEVEALVRRTRRWFVPLLAGACLVGAAAFPYIIPWVIGDASFQAGALPFAILMGGLALASPYLPFAQVLLMANRPGWHTVFVLIVVAVNFVANLLLIPVLGLAGAALAMSIAVVTVAAMLWRLAPTRAGVRL